VKREGEWLHSYMAEETRNSKFETRNKFEIRSSKRDALDKEQDITFDQGKVVQQYGGAQVGAPTNF
jgi:hypothetical protein